MQAARDNEAEFYASWKRHLATMIPDAEAGGSESETDCIMQLLGSDDEGPGPAAGPAAASAAPAAASAAAAPAAAADGGDA